MAIKIFIDQGHNPKNPNAGAEGNGLYEQNITYEVGILLAELLSANQNFEVKLSRPTPDTTLGSTNAESLATRASEANNWGADYFISIHANASTISSATGTEAFVYSSTSPAFTLAERITDGISSKTGLPNRGVYVRPSLYVLRKTRMPATLIELGFITNPSDAYLMDKYPNLFADGIYEGILRYFGIF
ncbi:MAG: N-acetylmuramoyl-L-alanine amidase [Clostridia bacterium]|nr:N-acetylmuramoyl-L-alanine amidase [Clostridia bacterium]MBQ9749052.1 N-acetylmuramoyl-L-alanine amidase [Clostridia bacterium]